MTGPKHLADGISEAINNLAGAPKTLANAPTEAYAYLSYAIERFRGGRRPDDPALQAAIKRGRVSVEAAWRAAESPIEKLLAPYLIFQDYGHLLSPAIVPTEDDDDAPADGAVLLLPQYELPGARLDFALRAITGGRTYTVAIECDGAEFHGLERDRLRDARLLKEFGIPTIRASGADIHEKPEVPATLAAIRLYDLVGA